MILSFPFFFYPPLLYKKKNGLMSQPFSHLFAHHNCPLRHKQWNRQGEKGALNRHKHKLLFLLFSLLLVFILSYACKKGLSSSTTRKIPSFSSLAHVYSSATKEREMKNKWEKEKIYFNHFPLIFNFFFAISRHSLTLVRSRCRF